MEIRIPPLAVDAGHEVVRSIDRGATTGRIGPILHQPAQMSAEISDPGRALALWNTLAPHRGSDAGNPVRATFISALDGSVTAKGASAGLGTDMDQAVFHGMRARAGTILVGAATARHEGYGPATVLPALSHLRTKSAPAPLWIVSRTLRREDIDHVSAAQESAAEGAGRLSLVVPESGAAPETRSHARENGVDVRVVPGGLDGFLRGAVELAGRENGGEIDCEGGPHLLEALLRAGLIDELVLSMSPHLHFPSGVHLLPQVAGADTHSWQRRCRVVSAFSSDDGGLYTRWIVDDDD